MFFCFFSLVLCRVAFAFLPKKSSKKFCWISFFFCAAASSAWVITQNSINNSRFAAENFYLFFLFLSWVWREIIHTLLITSYHLSSDVSFASRRRLWNQFKNCSIFNHSDYERRKNAGLERYTLPKGKHERRDWSQQNALRDWKVIWERDSRRKPLPVYETEREKK